MVVLMIKYAVFFDIDGTLATYNITISSHVKEYIYKLHKDGHSIFICTGRGYCDIPPSILSIPFDGFICSTGAYIVAKNNIIYECSLPKFILQYSFQYLKENHISAYFESAKCIYKVDFGIPLDDSYKTINKYQQLLEPIHTITYHSHNEYKLRDMINYLSEFCRIICHTPLVGDIIPMQTGKSNGMEIIQNYFNLNNYCTIAVGDSKNDIDMLEKADIGIAMKDSSTELFAVADYIAGSLDEDGIIPALKHFIKE